MNRIRVVCVMIVVLLSIRLNVLAAGTAVLETYTGENFISVYVRGGALEELSAQVGTGAADMITGQSLEMVNDSVRTLVMVDNSISIKESDRDKISTLLRDFVADRMINESIAIATFGEEIEYLCDYSSDYSTLKRACDSIDYHNQETYLSDVLFSVIENLISQDNDIFQRIVIISDGVDNKLLGITKEELYSAIKSNPYVVYTIGSLNKNGSNNEQLEDMFALSRMTGGEAILLDDYDDSLSIVDIFKTDMDIAKYIVYPATEQLDGSTKNIKICAGKNTYVVEAKMPQQNIKDGIELIGSEKPADEDEKIEINTENEKERSISVGFAIGVSLAIVVLAVICVLYAIRYMKRKSETKFNAVAPTVSRTTNDISNNDEGTVLIGMDSVAEDGRTICIWNESSTKSIILTDRNTYTRTYNLPIKDVIRIGRAAGNDVVIDYDKSISGKHCEITNREGRFFIRDAGSSNHTFVNTNKVISEVELFAGDIIKVGRVEMIFEVR